MAEQAAAAATNQTTSDEAPTAKVDGVAVLYILGGIPTIVGFLVLLFAVGVRYCGMPA